jgi:hypothetical protein
MSHSLAQGKTDWRQVRLALCLRKRPRRMGWRDVLRFSIRICPQRVEPFEGRPDIFLPGTLHHSGYKPAPPSDHTPLARRSAFGSDATTHLAIAFPSIPKQPPPLR